MNLDELKAEEERIKNLVPSDIVALRNIQAQIAQMELQAQTEQRVQEQEQKVQNFELPYDYNDLFENTTANETIMELIQQALRQAYTEHNNEIGKLNEEYKAKLKAAEDKHVDLHAQHDLLQTLHTQLQAEHNQTKLERDDALAKRDAAVSELTDAKKEIDRLNDHLDDLRKDAAVGARNAMNVTDINVNDRLAELAKKAKESAAEKAARALERWNTSNPELAAPQLEVAAPAPTFPNAQPTSETNHHGDTQAADASVQPPVVPAPTFQVPSGTGLGESAQGTDGKGDGANVEERLAALESRVAALEQAKAGQAA